MLAGLADKLQVEREIVLAGKLAGKKLTSNKQMAQIRLGISVVNKRCPLRVYR